MNNKNNKITNSIKNQLPLSRIHRLIRPLRSSLISFKQSIDQIQNNQNNLNNLNNNHQNNHNSNENSSTHHFLKPRINKTIIKDNQDYYESIRKKSNRKKYTRTNNSNSNNKNNKNTNPISSPIFNHIQNHSSSNNNKSKNNKNNTSPINSKYHLQIELQTKLDKIILAYKNILDATLQPLNSQNDLKNKCSPRSSDHHVDNLTTSCARVIGNFIEHAIELESSHHNRGEMDDSMSDSPPQVTSLLIEPDWKTSVMDEWYDAIPLLYRRCALAQHALKIILLGLPPQPTPKKSKSITASATTSRTINHSQGLFLAIHSLHRGYTSTSVQPQANSLLPSLLGLPTTHWFDIYDDYSHRFDLQERFKLEFFSRVESLSFLEFCSDRELIVFIDLTMHQFGSWIIEKWIHQRESLIISRSVWRSKHESRQAGLESSDPEDLDPGMTDDVITEYDKQTSPVLIQWIQSLVINCLPDSVHCKSARIQLNAISRLIFDSLMAFNLDLCSKSDNYFLSLISITIESHRLVLFGLPMFNTAAIDKQDQTSEWSSLHTPMRLQALIPKVITNLDQKIFNKATKLFFRAHRSTRLLAILPGLLSTRHQPIIPGLDQLLEFVIKGEYSIEFVAKIWVESLLKSDPKSWWIEADSHGTSLNGSTASEEEDQARSKGAQDVRIWLENWLPILDQAEKLRSNLSDHDSSDDHHNQSEREIHEQNTVDQVDNPVDLVDQQHILQDTKPPITCTCPSTTHEQPTVWEEDESKPSDVIDPTNSNHMTGTATEHNENIGAENDNETKECTKPTTGATSLTNYQQIRVIAPTTTTKKRRRKSSFLSLPSTRSRSKRKKSATPALSLPHPSAASPSSSLRSSSITFDPQSTSTTTTTHFHHNNNQVGSAHARPRRTQRRFHSSLFPSPNHLEDKKVDSNHFNRHDNNNDNDDDDDDDDDEFDAMDLLVSSHRLKTPVLSFPPPSSSSSSSSSARTSAITLVTNSNSNSITNTS